MSFRLFTLAMLAAATLGATAVAGTVTVVPGDSLYRIVREQFPHSHESWTAISRDIVRLNPHAFRNDDPGSLRVGVELQMPVYDDTTTSAAGAQPLPASADAEPAAPATPPVHSLAVIGEVIEIDGSPLAIDINNRERKLTLGSKVYRGDALLSDLGGSARVIMNDGAELLLRPFSRLLISEYTFIESDAATSRSVIKLLKGGMRFITGLIGRRNPSGFSVHTNVATIGVRGTDFATMLCSADDCVLPDGGTLSEGTYSGVLDGAIGLGNDAGEFAVARGEVVRTSAPSAPPEPAPEAARLLFTAEELALLEPEQDKPMNFFQWLRHWFGGGA